MIKHVVYDVDEMKKIEDLTAKSLNCHLDDLIWIAGEKLFFTMIEKNLTKTHEKLLFIIGKGNNGADGLVVMKHCLNRDHEIGVIWMDFEHRSPIQDQIWQSINQHQVKVHSIDQIEQILPTYDVLIDGLLGIGLKETLDPKYQHIINKINEAFKNVISIDIPSGLSAHHGLAMPIAIQATHTLICHAYKPGNLLSDAKDYHGDIHLVPMGFIDKKSHHKHLIEFEETDLNIKKRKYNTHKYQYGHLLIFGGSRSYMGAPVLSAHAAFRMGAGLVTWAIDDLLMYIHSNHWPEVIKTSYKDLSECISLAEKKQAIVYGPGLGIDHQIADDALKTWINHDIPMVIDADGLLSLKGLLDEESMHFNHIMITPHVMELSKLTDIKINRILYHPIEILHQLSQKLPYIILKGPCTLVQMKEETYFFNIGHPGLAKAGLGDVLSGILGALLLSHNIEESIFLGLNIFNQTSILTKKLYGEHSMTASDFIETIPQILSKTKQL